MPVTPYFAAHPTSDPGEAMKLVFWNVDGKPPLARTLAEHIQPDLLIIAEADADAIKADLQSLDKRWREVTRIERRTKDGTRRDLSVFDCTSTVSPTQGGTKIVALRAMLPVGAAITVIAAHLSSQSFKDPATISSEDFPELRDMVLSAEKRHSDRRTLILGDFNIDPFDEGLCRPDKLIGVMSRDEARRLAGNRRDVPSSQQRADATFYNPMWSRLGDTSAGPPGTYWYADINRKYYWHTFDQVLIRPELIEHFSDLQVLDSLGGESLLDTHGRPDRSRWSDHLPLTFCVH